MTLLWIRHGEKKFASTKTAMMHRGRGAVQLKRTLKRTLLFVLHSIDTICCDMMIERIEILKTSNNENWDAIFRSTSK